MARQSLEERCQIDLIRGFFTNLLERDSIAAADASRGRFRAFLYASLDHSVINVDRRVTESERQRNRRLNDTLTASGLPHLAYRI